MFQSIFLIQQEKSKWGYSIFCFLTIAIAYLSPEFLLLSMIVAGVSLIHEIGHLVSLWVFRLNWQLVGLGVGPLVLCKHLPGFQLRVHALWMGGGYFYTRAALKELALWQQLVLWISGPLANFVLMVLCVAWAVSREFPQQWHLLERLLVGIFSLAFHVLAAIATFDTNLETILAEGVRHFAFLHAQDLSVGFIYLNIMAFISCLLGLYNLLPLPGSDGYKIFRSLGTKLLQHRTKLLQHRTKLLQHRTKRMSWRLVEQQVVSKALVIINLYMLVWGLSSAIP